MNSQIKYAANPLFIGNDNLPTLSGTAVDATGGFAVKKPNGKYLSVPPNGIYTEASSIGAYETFNWHRTMMWFGVSYVQSDGPSAGLPVNLWVPYSGV